VTRWTEEQLAEFQSRVHNARRLPPVDVSVRPFALPANTAGAFALGRLPAGTMNKSEAQYAAHLDQQRHAGLVLWWMFEGLKFRLGNNTFYTPDFVVMPADCRIELHEVKGYWRDDGRAKIKIAAAQFPFRFIAVTKRTQKAGGGWEREEFT